MTAPSLTEFLLARVAEDEIAANAATGNAWTIRKHDDKDPKWSVQSDAPHELASQPGKRDWTAVVVGVVFDRAFDYPDGGCASEADASHIARHDPARVLAECAAKRELVGLLTDAELGPIHADAWHMLKVAVGRFATMYVDHPDYRQEWAA